MESTTNKKTTIRCRVAIKASFRAFASFTYRINFKILKILISRIVRMVLMDEILFVFAPMAMPKYEGSKANRSIIP